MKVYIFEHLNEVSDNYHNDGGLVVIARDRTHVVELIEKECYIKITAEEWKEVVEHELNDNPDPKVYVFPDAGCC